MKAIAINICGKGVWGRGSQVGDAQPPHPKFIFRLIQAFYFLDIAPNSSFHVFLGHLLRAVAVLPKIIQERTVQPFKFWFNGSLHDGLHVHNELYYRLKQQSATTRSRLYQLAWRLSQQGADVVLTVDEQQCSLWANLRNQKVAALAFSERIPLPSVDKLLA